MEAAVCTRLSSSWAFERIVWPLLRLLRPIHRRRVFTRDSLRHARDARLAVVIDSGTSGARLGVGLQGYCRGALERGEGSRRRDDAIKHWETAARASCVAGTLQLGRLPTRRTPDASRKPITNTRTIASMTSLRILPAPTTLEAGATPAKVTILPNLITTCYILPMQFNSNATPSATPAAGRTCKRLCPKSSTTKDLLRCKRRIDFAGLGYSLPKPKTESVTRRNERERNRVRLVNQSFARLRDHVPEAIRKKKSSKVDTLKSAVDYIRSLQQLLDDSDAVNAAFGPGAASVSTLQPDLRRFSSGSGYSSDCSGPSPGSSPGHTPGHTSSHSGYSTDCSVTSVDSLSAEDVDLLDFASWFQ